MLMLCNAQIITESSLIPHGWLKIANDTIDSFGAGDAPSTENARVVDASGLALVAGFIDIHVHGGGGHEAMDATPHALNALSHFYAQHGVTSFLPTTWTASSEAIHHALRNIAQSKTDGARVVGAHIEGPYINPTKPGAQSSQFVRRANMTEFEAWYDTGTIKLVTLAPEFEENLRLIEFCEAHNIVTSAGHTDATYDQIRHAIGVGLRHTTHTYNAMRPLHHREPGTVGGALLSPELRCEVICDGVHVHPQMVNLLWQMKGSDGLILITDAVRGAGLPDGTTYPLDDRTVTIRDGSAYLDDTTLAGSTLTMDVALKNFIQFTHTRLEDVWQCASLTPARALGIDNVTGSIQTGKYADLVLLNADLRVMMTIVGGQVVYER
ncbi:MAG: N-acetylglucosamine-6-phosphate deacetylase [Phototrophicales bacterium]|nr:N-acetylglucosamine-6-phosphate deacetylase [Phototrophicales bacterium]